MTKALQGYKILVTRPAAQARNLCNLIAAQGGTALRFPTLEIVAMQPDPKVLQMATDSDWWIFTSSNAVDFAILAFDGKMPLLPSTRIAAVGEATANALRKSGWRVDCLPASEFNSEGLLAELALHAESGQSFVIVRGMGGREKLAQTLIESGAKVQYLEVYRRLKPNADSSDLANCLVADQLDAVTITSVEALQNLLAMLDENLHALLMPLPLIVMSDRIKQIADQLGFKRIAVSKQPTDAAILETLAMFLNGENSGRIIRKTTRQSSAHCGG